MGKKHFKMNNKQTLNYANMLVKQLNNLSRLSKLHNPDTSDHKIYRVPESFTKLIK